MGTTCTYSGGISGVYTYSTRETQYELNPDVMHHHHFRRQRRFKKHFQQSTILRSGGSFHHTKNSLPNGVDFLLTLEWLLYGLQLRQGSKVSKNTITRLIILPRILFLCVSNLLLRYHTSLLTVWNRFESLPEGRVLQGCLDCRWSTASTCCYGNTGQHIVWSWFSMSSTDSRWC